MTTIIEKTMDKISFIQNPTLEEYFHSDAEARNFAASLVNI
jgi:1-deoxy-D-xylulose-5-phosphate reductoisomerase